MPSEHWNISAFGKYYHQYVSGPMATDDKGTDYVLVERTVHSAGYGAAGTYFILPELQAKLSYEKAYRLPTIEEMFGDEDLESGEVNIRPENSDNVNLNISYSKNIGKHSVYVEGGLIYRNTKDYIQRNIQDLSGGKENATYTNYGKVVTKDITCRHVTVFQVVQYRREFYTNGRTRYGKISDRQYRNVHSQPDLQSPHGQCPLHVRRQRRDLLLARARQEREYPDRDL